MVEHAFVRIEKDIKAGRIPGLVLLCGKEDYLTDHYREVLVEKLSDPAARQLDVTVLTRQGFEMGELEDNMESLPIMSEKKIVVLDGLVNSRGQMPTRSLESSTTERKRLMDLIGKVPETCILIITADKQITTGDHSKQSSGARLEQLKKAVTKAGGSIYDFGPLEKDQLRSFVAKRFRTAGKNCTNGALKRIIYDTGYGGRYSTYDLYALDNDLKKIIAYAGEKDTVTEDDLVGTLTMIPENNIFHMLEAIGMGRIDQALIDLNTLFEGGESEFAILSNLVRQIEIMLISREMMDENNSLPQTVKLLDKEEKVNKFRAEKATKVASRFQSRQLKKMMIDAIAIEENIKSGIMSPRLALEYFIAVGQR